MESRFRHFFLNFLLAMATTITAEVQAQSDDSASAGLIQPDVERIDFDESRIDADDFEISAYFGLMAVEDFSTEVVSGFKLGYHISEDIFVNTSIASVRVGKTSFEILGGGAPLLSSDERDLEYYLVNLGYNLLPGEAFLTDSTTLNTVLFLSAGIGTTTFAGDDRFTIAYSIGYRSLFSDYFSVDFEVRDLVFDMDLLGAEKSTHNLELSLGLNLFF